MSFKLRGHLRPSCPHNSKILYTNMSQRVAMAKHLAVFALSRPTTSSNTQTVPEHLIPKATGSFIPGLQRLILQ